MKKLRDLKEGTAVKIDTQSTINYYIRGKAKNGRVHIKCYTKSHERYTHLDRYLNNNVKAEQIKLQA